MQGKGLNDDAGVHRKHIFFYLIFLFLINNNSIQASLTIRDVKFKHTMRQILKLITPFPHIACSGFLYLSPIKHRTY